MIEAQHLQRRDQNLRKAESTMQIQVHTENHIEGNAALTNQVENSLSGALDRFGPQIMRVEVYLNDLNGPKSGSRDIRCTLEARLAGSEPVAISHDAETLEQAIDGAT